MMIYRKRKNKQNNKGITREIFFHTKQSNNETIKCDDWSDAMLQLPVDTHIVRPILLFPSNVIKISNKRYNHIHIHSLFCRSKEIY